MSIWLRPLCIAVMAMIGLPGLADGQAVEGLIGQPIVNVRFEVEGRPDLSLALLGLSAVRIGQPLRQDDADIRATITRLDGLGRYEGISVVASPVEGGVEVVFRLTPRYPVTALEITGDTGVSAGALRRQLQQRYGGVPSTARVPVVETTARQFLNDEGYLEARVSGRTEPTPGTQTATLFLDVDAGPLTVIRTVAVHGDSQLSSADIIRRSRTTAGLPYKRRQIETALTGIEDDLRSRGFYEAQLTLQTSPSPDGVDIVINVNAGPRVEVRVTPRGAMPGSIDEFIPIRRLGSADQDLLEDSRARIERALRAEGYWKASAPFTRSLERDGSLLVITFTIDRGPRYYVERVELPSDLSLPAAELRTLIGLSRGDLFDEDRFLAGLTRVADAYRRAGYYAMRADPTYEEVPTDSASRAAVVLHPTITEGPAGRVAAINFARSEPSQVPEDILRQATTSRVGQPYVEQEAARDQAALRSMYLDRGFSGVVVAVVPEFGEDGRQVTLNVRVEEGARVVIGDISVVGNEHVSTEVILDALRLQAGQPASQAVLEDARRRLVDMGVFRRITISLAERSIGELRAHVIVNVVESPATAIGWGGGLEGGRYTRTIEGRPEDRLEFAPRGFFEISRRNLGGRNRALSLFSRASLKRQRTVEPRDEENGEGFGFTEYRVAGTFRERHAFGTATDLLVGFMSEQGVRTNFNFVRQRTNAEMLRELSPNLSVSGRYALEFTRLFDERIGDDDPDRPLIDRIFPEVRLSILSTGVSWDGRDNPIDPTRGAFVTGDMEVAARSIGSEVGYLKTFFQASGFRGLDTGARTVVATRAMLGLARGFPRTVEVVQPDGTTVEDVVEDLPASQRFFGGGSTTVRGFQLDRLGVDEIINADGLSLGGNGIVVLNVEIRRIVMRMFGRNLGAVGFLDGGNVFGRASQLDIKRLRAAAGFGVRYDSPLGPLRLDFGFKLRPRTSDGRPERGWEYHLSIGEAF